MMRVAVRFAYDGSHFHSYARQPGRRTVESALLAALAHDGLVEGSWRSGSRTDRGVSAAENVGACVLDRPHLKGLVPAVQKHLPDGLWITGAAHVAGAWNPRHAASRTYLYFAPRQEEALAAMRGAAAAFAGSHDMSAFARVEAHRDPVREVSRFTVAPVVGGWRFTVEGPSFLWNQVRRMVDAVLRVARGEAGVGDVEAALASGRPHRSFKVAAAEGLLLARLRYRPAIRWDAGAGRLPDAVVSAAWSVAQRDRVLAEAVTRHGQSWRA